VAPDSTKPTSRPGKCAPLGGGVLAVLLALVLGAYVYDHDRGEMIAPGVRIAAVDVGGLRAPAARSRLYGELRGLRADWITVRYGALRFTLTGGQAGLSADVNGAVREAVSVSRGGWFLGRTLRDLFGGHIDTDIPLHVSYSRSAVDGFVARIRSAIDRPAGEATMTVDSGARLVTIHSQTGIAVNLPGLRGELERALRELPARHVLDAPVRTMQPQVTTQMLAAEYPAYIVVDWPAFKLLLYQHLRLTHAYPIAVGRAGLETPAGLHHILDKQVNPSWYVPHSAWAGSLADKVIPPGP
jgi:putative peptidoglycan binding protein/L,D-transpeptidase-like protein